MKGPAIKNPGTSTQWAKIIGSDPSEASQHKPRRVKARLVNSVWSKLSVDKVPSVDLSPSLLHSSIVVVSVLGMAETLYLVELDLAI